MTLVTRTRQRYASGAATSPNLTVPADEGTVVARLVDHDWGTRPGNFILERSDDGGLSWQLEARAGGAMPDSTGAFYLESTVDRPRRGARLFRARVESDRALNAAIEVESIPTTFPVRNIHQSIAFVQVKRAGSAGASTLDCVFDVAPTSGRRILSFGSITSAPLTVDSANQDPAGANTAFTAITTTQTTGAGSDVLRSRVFELRNCGTHATIRCTFSGSQPCGHVVHEISGDATGTAISTTDGVGWSQTGGGTGTTLDSGNITPTAGNYQLVGFGKTSGAHTQTAGASYTIRTPPSGTQRESSEDRNVTADGSTAYAATITTNGSDEWHMWIVAVPEAVAAATPIAPTIITNQALQRAATW